MFINKIILLLIMDNASYNLKSDRIYQLGTNIGFFAAFLLFASMFYLLMSLSHKIPESIRYYHVLLFVIIVYFAGFLMLKLWQKDSFS